MKKIIFNIVISISEGLLAALYFFVSMIHLSSNHMISDISSINETTVALIFNIFCLLLISQIIINFTTIIRPIKISILCFIFVYSLFMFFITKEINIDLMILNSIVIFLNGINLSYFER
ncbi:MAG: hypothetical protein M3005_03930 [Apilactobacillus sp.]|uniref:hypothetical protein n=1 Tax=Apilactobacillus TaxID=2767877 RepID=UPI0025E78223|nr:hypothetical protein [Apilactobacillus sp.]MCT6823007.1 hypothetical protein [Apilactobacillus sp.]MCT6858707.1 hypothetical protein [Apilactobacillus sp.]